MKGEFNLQNKIDEVGFENCFISELTIAELLFGVENSAESKKEQNRQNVNNLKLSFGIRIIPITTCLELYAKEKTRLRREGTPIGEFDLIIGCTAIANQMIMTTRNVKHLEKIENIILENWIDE